MGYVGVPPQSGFITTAKQRVTSSTNNYVDLDHSISSLADVIVWVNFVKQDSTNLSLTSSSRITLGATLQNSDIVEISFLGKAVATQSPPVGGVSNDMLAGSIANDKLAGSIANSKLANSSVSINGSSVSLGGSITGIGESNIPNFHANQASTSISNNVGVTVVYSNEVWDTASLYNTSTGKFTVTSATTGYYLIYAGVKFNVMSSNRVQLRILYNNGSSNITFALTEIQISSGYAAPHVAVVVPLLSNGHYVYTEAYQNSGGTIGLSNEVEGTYFGGFKLG